MTKLLPFLYCSLLTITCSLFTASAQDQHLIDSLSTLLKTAKEDTTKANILITLSKAYSQNNLDKGIDYAEQSLRLSEQINYNKGIGNALNTMGSINNDKGDYLLALEFHKKALKVREEIKDKRGIADSLNNLANCFTNLGYYPEALKNLFAALKMNEESGNKKWQGFNLNGISNIYYLPGNYLQAIKYRLVALKIAVEMDDKPQILNLYTNLGSDYLGLENYQEALKNYSAALKIANENGSKNDIAVGYLSIGNVYNHQGRYPEALQNSFTALKIFEEIEFKYEMATAYLNIGDTYTKQKKYNDASEYINKALTLSKEIGLIEIIRDCYVNLAVVDSVRGNFKQAYENHKLYITYRDSMLNNENTKKITQQQMQYDFDKKESIAKAAQEKKDIRQRNIRNSILAGLIGTLIFGIVVFRQRNKISKARKRSDQLLLNILPEEVAEELKAKGEAAAKQFDEVTVMFTDFKGFTQISEKLTPSELVAEIHTCFMAFDNIITKYNIEKIKTIGDAYMCAGGLPVTNTTNAIDVVSAAMEIQKFMLEHLKQRKSEGNEIFEIRIGVHTGPVVAGIVGVKKFAYDIWGDTVNIASRMESSSEAGKINISGPTYELVKGHFACTYRGKIQAKNKGEVDMYFVESTSLQE